LSITIYDMVFECVDDEFESRNGVFEWADEGQVAAIEGSIVVGIGLRCLHRAGMGRSGAAPVHGGDAKDSFAQGFTLRSFGALWAPQDDRRS
jgi:hypothetical protein